MTVIVFFSRTYWASAREKVSAFRGCPGQVITGGSAIVEDVERIPLEIKSKDNILNRKILPVLNRCGVCRQSKLSHDAGEVSHEYVRDGSLPKWHGFHSFAVDSLPHCTISEWMTC